MFADSGAKLPPGLRTVTPEDVGAGVVKAIRRNRGEVVVAPVEIRAGGVLGSLLPELAAVVQKAGGSSKVSSAIAEGHRDNR